MVKHNVWKTKAAAQLALPIVDEDLIRVFYSGMHDKDGSCYIQMNCGSPGLEYLFLILMWKMNRIRW